MFHRQRGVSNQAVVIAIVVAVLLAALLYIVFFNASGGTQTVNGTVEPRQLQPSTSAETQAGTEPETTSESTQEDASAESQTESDQREGDALAESEVTPEDGAPSEAESQEATEDRATPETPESAELESQETVEQAQEETSSATLEASERAQEDTPVEAYTVTGGDTLYSIARNHDTTVTALVEANAIADPHQISVGQVVTIPAQQTNQGEGPNRTYTVQAKDTLYSIAKRYATSVNAVAEANDITDSGVIKIGQVLRMPLNASLVPK